MVKERRPRLGGVIRVKAGWPDHGHPRDLCVWCMERRRKLTREHIVPTSQGGNSHWENLAVACRLCNTSRSSSSLLAWVWAMHAANGSQHRARRILNERSGS